MALLEVTNLGIAFGGLQAVEKFALSIEKGHLYGLIGPNGAGKTTVFNMLTGVYQPTEGDIVLEEEDAHNYRRAIIRDGKLDSILLQGKIDYSGIYQYLIKNQIDLSGKEQDIFHLSFADFYGVKENGAYCYQI